MTLWTVVHQASLSMKFFRQEYWNGLPFPSPGDLSDPGTEPESPALQTDSLLSKSPKQDPDTGKDQRQKEKRAVEYELVRQHHCINECELEQTLGDTEGQGSWHSAVLGVAKSLTWFSDGTTTKKHCMDICYGLNCVLPKFICWSLNPQTSKGTLFGSRAV